MRRTRKAKSYSQLKIAAPALFLFLLAAILAPPALSKMSISIPTSISRSSKLSPTFAA